MLFINIVIWIFVSMMFDGMIRDYTVSEHDLFRSNDFIPSYHDITFSFFIGGVMIIWIYHSFIVVILSKWQLYRMSPLKKWAFKNLSIWGYFFLAVLAFPVTIYFIAVPGLFLIEKTGIHFGDAIMPFITDSFALSVGILINWFSV